MKNVSCVEELGKSRATISLLLFLNKEGESKITGLIGQVAGQKGVYQAVKTLLKLGLANERTGKEFPHPRLISLTEAGRQVAENLNKIEITVNQSASFTVGKNDNDLDSSKTGQG